MFESPQTEDVAVALREYLEARLPAGVLVVDVVPTDTHMRLLICTGTASIVVTMDFDAGVGISMRVVGDQVDIAIKHDAA
jgi:hypothetical protein